MSLLCMLSSAWVRPSCLNEDCIRRQDRPGAWHSQEQQDRHIAAIFNGKRNGYFIDCAANEPVQISNTRALERDYGWNGLCIEPNHIYWPALQRTRRCKLATNPVSDVEERTFMVERGAFSTFVPKHHRQWSGAAGMNATALHRARMMQVRTRRLDSLLAEHDAPTTIDYLSLDVEVRPRVLRSKMYSSHSHSGSSVHPHLTRRGWSPPLACGRVRTWQGHEYEAMLSFPFDRHELLLLSVERPNAKLSSLLTSRGFRYVCDHGVYGDEMWALHGAPSSSSKIRQWLRGQQQPAPTSRLPQCALTSATPIRSDASAAPRRRGPVEKPRCMLESDVLAQAAHNQDPCRGDPASQLHSGGSRRARCLVTAVEPNGQRWVLVVGRNYSCQGGEVFRRAASDP